MGAASKGVVLAAQAMLVVSGLFEPIRILLYDLGFRQAVGGVGGVGGLANLSNPDRCSSDAGRMGAYCYEPGLVAGLSLFAAITLAVWAAPMLLGAVALVKSTSTTAAQCSDPADQEAHGALADGAQGGHRLVLVWTVLSALWFLLPLAYFLSSSFYRSGPMRVVLAIAISAAYPLSWHLSLVAIPVSELVAPHLGLSDATVKGFHKTMGRFTAGWGALHGMGELIYLSSNGLLKQLSFIPIATKGENLIYLLGVTTLAILAAHGTLALARKQPWLRGNFRAAHRCMAVAVLLCATAHWWPFALFLLPAAAAHGGAAAVRWRRARGRQVSKRQEAMGLLVGGCGALLGFAAAWTVRDAAMRAPEVDMLSPFAYPPLALLAEGLGSWAAAALWLRAAPSPASGADQLWQPLQ